MKGLLRPSARDELIEFVRHLKSSDEVQTFVDWTTAVLSAHKESEPGQRRDRSIRAMRNLPVFRRPERAYRPRSIF